MIGVQRRTFRDQYPVNIQAAELVGQLHDSLFESGYRGHDLERFLVRIVFCLFAYDTGIFEPRDIFLYYIETHTGEDGYQLATIGNLFMGIKLKRQDKTDSKDNLANLRHGQAIAMQYVGYLLQRLPEEKNQKYLSGLLENVTLEGGGNGIEQTRLGCNWVVNIVMALTVEFALKALLIKNRVAPHNRHDLLKLYTQLSLETRNQLENKFRTFIENGEVIGTDSLCQLLTSHKDDFVDWRYLDKEPENLISECRELQFAVLAILDVYDSERL